MDEITKRIERKMKWHISVKENMHMGAPLPSLHIVLSAHCPQSERLMSSSKVTRFFDENITKHKQARSVWSRMATYNKKKFLYPFRRLRRHVTKRSFNVSTFHLLFHSSYSLNGPHDLKLEEGAACTALKLNRKTYFHPVLQPLSLSENTTTIKRCHKQWCSTTEEQIVHKEGEPFFFHLRYVHHLSSEHGTLTLHTHAPAQKSTKNERVLCALSQSHENNRLSLKRALKRT